MPSPLPGVVHAAGICPLPSREWSALREYSMRAALRAAGSSAPTDLLVWDKRKVAIGKWLDRD
eukprot:4568801-Pyramimonas_sp.AAC.1